LAFTQSHWIDQQHAQVIHMGLCRPRDQKIASAGENGVRAGLHQKLDGSINSPLADFDTSISPATS
jgi:hypothetical protein